MSAHVRMRRDVCPQVYERALPYFELAAAIQPKEVKWSLMVASCYRRIGAYEQALRRWVRQQAVCQNAALQYTGGSFQAVQQHCIRKLARCWDKPACCSRSDPPVQDPADPLLRSS